MDVTMVKCASADCACVVKTDGAFERDGRFYCSAECADHHKDGSGCHHAGCTCQG